MADFDRTKHLLNERIVIPGSRLLWLADPPLVRPAPSLHAYYEGDPQVAISPPASREQSYHAESSDNSQPWVPLSVSSDSWARAG